MASHDKVTLDWVIQNDDLENAKEFPKVFGDIDCRLKDLNGREFTFAWWAASGKANKVLRFCVQKGADVEFSITNGLSVRHVALAHAFTGDEGPLIAMIEGGMKPSQQEVMSLCNSSQINFIPDDTIVGFINDVLQIFNEPNWILDDKDVEELYSSRALDGVLAKHLVVGEEVSEETVLAVFSAMQPVMQDAVLLLSQHTDLLDRAIVRHFAGFRNHHKWLRDALDRCASQIAESTAEQFGRFQDDEQLLMAARLAVLRYPVRARITGVAEVADFSNQEKGSQFELKVSSLLREAGFLVEERGGSGDQGADLLAYKDGLSFAIQCKNHTKTVGNKAVQEVLAAKEFYKTDYAVVTCPQGFTTSAKALAARSNVLLLPLEMIADLYSLRKLID